MAPLEHRVAPVRIGTAGPVGRITLARPEKINALTVEMVHAVAEALTSWERDPAVSLVVIDGDGDRGLCAGGDIAAVYHGIRGDADDPARFWRHEYRMNLQIARYPKPVVAVMDGLVLGGGVGISGHASVRIVTETSQVGMPETAIGLSPDVGGLYLLSRAPGELGTHAALTGMRLGPGDAIAAGLADHFVPRDRLADVLRAMTAAPGSAPHADHWRSVLATASSSPAEVMLGPDQRAWIDECYRGDDAALIHERLAAHSSPQARAAAATLARMSPTAVAVTLRAIRKARHMTLAEVLEQDLMLSTAFARHGDFVEGIRAQIIDKDRSPAWKPATLAEVAPADVDAFFDGGAAAG